MNWAKALIAGVVAGVVTWIVNYVLHGVILGNTYAGLPNVFTQVPASPFWFLLVAIFISIFAAILFAKSRRCWAKGWKGGLIFGFWLGLVAFWSHFYSPLVIDGFPYFLAWCHGGCDLIVAVVGGSVIGAIYPSP